MSKRTSNQVECPECAAVGQAQGVRLNEANYRYECANGHSLTMDELAKATVNKIQREQENGHDLATPKQAPKAAKKSPKKKAKKAAKTVAVKPVQKARPKVVPVAETDEEFEENVSQIRENDENALSQIREEAPPQKPTAAEEALMPFLSQTEHDLPNGDVEVRIVIRELYVGPSAGLAQDDRKTLTEWVQDFADLRFEEFYGGGRQ